MQPLATLLRDAIHLERARELLSGAHDNVMETTSSQSGNGLESVLGCALGLLMNKGQKNVHLIVCEKNQSKIFLK